MAWVGCPTCAQSVRDSATVCPHCGATLKSSPRAAALRGPQISCEKCKTGQMGATRVPRFSSTLRVIGFTLWIPAVLFLAGSTVMVCVTTEAGSKAAVEQSTKTRHEGANRLQGIGQMPDSVVEDFREDGRVEETVLVTLSAGQRDAVRREMSSYGAALVRSTLGTGAVGAVGGCGLLALCFVLVPTMIIGFVLTLKKNVWQCGNCGYIFDRALALAPANL